MLRTGKQGRSRIKKRALIVRLYEAGGELKKKERIEN